MNLLLVIDDLGSGGAQRQMVNLACALATRGHNIEFFVYYPQDHFRPPLDKIGIQVHLHEKFSRYSIAPIVALRRLIGNRRYDIVLAFLDTPSFYAEISRLGLRKTKLVISERSMYPSGMLPLSLRLRQECHRLADAITVNSHHQRERMIQEFPSMSTKISTIYNGVDLERFSPDQTREDRSNESLLLIAIGTIVANKNMLGLAKALTNCRDRYNLKPIVHWVGKNDKSEDGRRAFAEISDYLDKNFLIEQWEWLGERTDIPDLLRQHDALVHPSFYEGLPNVVCEALSCGLPVLVSNVCDHPWLVEEGVNGFLFDPIVPESIAKAIYQFHRVSPEQRHKMRKAARKFAEANLSVTCFAEKYEKLFVSLTVDVPFKIKS